MTDLVGVPLLRTVIPDEFADKLRLIASNWRTDRFLIGDIRNSLKAMVEERLLPICAPDIDNFLSECLNHEVEPRTVRYYAMVADAFPYNVRDEFASLSFAHFAFAQSMGESKAIEVLKMARDHETVTGRVPSVDWLRAAQNGYLYEKQSNDAPSMPDAAEYGYPDDANIPIDESEPAQPGIPGWLTGFQRAVKFGLNHIESVPVSSDARMKLHDLLAQIDTILSECSIMV